MRKWLRSLVYTMGIGMVVGGILLAEAPHIASVQNPQTMPTSTIDLSGNWKLDSKPGVVKIQHLLESNRVIAIFTPGQQCHNMTWSNLFDTKLIVTPVGAGEAKLSLADAKYFSCTSDSYMVDACGTAVWESKMREVTVSPDGSMISGKRFYEGLQWDGTANGKYVNCRHDPGRDGWVTFTLTRACEPNKARRCANLARAIKLTEKIVPPAVNHMPSVSFDPVRWQQTLSTYQPALSGELDNLRKEFCDDSGAQDGIDKMKETLAAIKPGAAQTQAAVRAEMLKIVAIDLELKGMSTSSCWIDEAPPQRATGVCGGVPPKKPGDNEDIDKAIKPINDAIKEAQKMIEDYEREAQGGASTTAGQYADYWRTRLGQLQKLKGYWDMIRAASCIPPELMALIRAVMGGRTDVCIDLCWETAKWIEKWYPGPGGDIQKKLFLESCGFSCP